MDRASSFLLITAYSIRAYSNAHQECPQMRTLQNGWPYDSHGSGIDMYPFRILLWSLHPPCFALKLSPSRNVLSGQREPFVDCKPSQVVLPKFAITVPIRYSCKAYKTGIIFPRSDVVGLQQYELTLPTLPDASSGCKCYRELLFRLQAGSVTRSLGYLPVTRPRWFRRFPRISE